jgi:hypothetical protein
VIAPKITHANAKMSRRTTARADSALGRVSDNSVEASVQVIRSAITPTTVRIAPKKATSFAALISSVRHLSQLAMPIVDTTAVVVNMGASSDAQKGHAMRHETRSADGAQKMVNDR